LVQITGNDRNAVELHQQMMLVSSAIMPITGLCEISLRNAVCTELREMFGSDDWLNKPPLPFIWRDRQPRCAAWRLRADASCHTHQRRPKLR
jgi:hypothetical protein